jgi:hypothetical protein
VGEAGIVAPRRFAEGGGQPAGGGAGRGDRDLLSEHGAQQQFEAVDRAGDPDARGRGDRWCQQRVRAEDVRHGGRVGVQVE